jgi:soluble lytic murein transglycosylase-like protein
MTALYDPLIRLAAQDHLYGTDWRLLKAQLMAESALNPHAVSAAGARGIAQFMPDTWAEVTRAMGVPTANITDATFAIPACAFYMAQLLESWTAPRPPMDRYCLALASYNAGKGNLLKAQKLAGMVNDYKSISAHLASVTGDRNAKETCEYVRRIYGLFLGYAIGYS